MICKNCGQEIQEGAAFCQNCGTKVDSVPVVEGYDYCMNCGAKIPMNTDICPVCGRTVTNPLPTIGTDLRSMPSGDQDFTVTPAAFTLVQEAPEKEENAAPPVKKQGMKWFRFLIRFSLFFGAVVNLSSGIMYLTGYTYILQQSNAAVIYRYFPLLSYIDKVYGISLLVMAVFCIYTRHRLARFKKNGPSSYFILQVAAIVLTLGYTLAVYVSLSVYQAETFTLQTILSDFANPLINIVILILNTVYFHRRKHLFIN